MGEAHRRRRRRGGWCERRGWRRRRWRQRRWGVGRWLARRRRAWGRWTWARWWSGGRGGWWGGQGRRIRGRRWARAMRQPRIPVLECQPNVVCRGVDVRVVAFVVFRLPARQRRERWRAGRRRRLQQVARPPAGLHRRVTLQPRGRPKSRRGDARAPAVRQGAAAALLHGVHRFQHLLRAEERVSSLGDAKNSLGDAYIS
jgi:hypothetical protein